ncbi:UNVERIFIED_CONTAM: hypothetical protein BEN50_04245 [Euhalothece sp. KZN 001]
MKHKLINSRHYLKYKVGLQEAYSQTSLKERECLKKYASNKKRLAEIGVFEGVNTKNFRSVMSEDAVLFAIDPYPRSFFGILGFGLIRRIAHKEVSKINRGQVIWLEKLGFEAVFDLKVKKFLPLDFLFIDGDHSWEGIKGDWESWKDCIEIHGIVALHDSINVNQVGSERYTQQIILKDKKFIILEQVDTLTILQKIN